MVGFWKFRTPIERIYSSRISLVGWLGIILGMVGVAVFTAFAKGKVTVCDDVVAGAARFGAPLQCSIATVYSGQRFMNANSNFSYTAVTWAQIERPTKCIVDQSRSLVGFISDLTWSADHGIWSSLKLLNEDYRNNMHIQYKTPGVVDGQGFEIYGSGLITYMSDEVDGTVYVDLPGTGNNPFVYRARQFFNVELQEAAKQGLTNVLSGVVWPCKLCGTRWQLNSFENALALFWAVAVACASIWAILRFFAEKLMSKMEKTPATPRDIDLESRADRRASLPGTPAPAYDPVFPPSAGYSPINYRSTGRWQMTEQQTAGIRIGICDLRRVRGLQRDSS